VAGHIPAASLVVDAMGHLPIVAEKKTDWHAEDFLNLALVRAQVEYVRHYADIGGDLDAEARHQTAQRADHFDQVRQQTDLLVRFAHRGDRTVEITGITPATGQWHCPRVS